MYTQQDQRPPLAKRIIWHPLLISSAFIFQFWASNSVHPFEALRSIAVALLGTLLLMYLLRLALRSWRAAGIATSSIWLLIASRQGLEDISSIAIESGAWRAVILALLLVAGGVFLIRGLRSYLRREHALSSITRALNIISTFLLIIVVGQAFLSGNLQTPIRDIGQAIERFMAKPPSVGARVPAGPDIYVFILDAYARQDTLANHGFDNGPFIAALEQRGFDVASQSRSNYPNTYLTLASMLNMTTAQSLPQSEDAETGRNGWYNAFRDASNRNQVFSELYDYGYRSAAIANLAPHVSLHGAYDYLDDGALNGFELELLRNTGLMSFIELASPDFLGNQYRQDVLSDLRMTRDLALDASHRPRLIVSHLISPHPPLAFDAQCEARPLTEVNSQEGVLTWEHARQIAGIEQLRLDYIEQLRCINDLVLPVIDDIVEGSAEPPVIIIMSDHGPSLSNSLAEHYGNFFASYTPGYEDLFPEDVTPINIFPTLLNTYLDGSHQTWPNTSYRYDVPSRAWVEVPVAAP